MLTYVISNEDRQILGVAEDLATALNFAADYAEDFGAEIGEYGWNEADFNSRGFWSVPCYPDGDVGFLFYLNIETVEFYKAGTLFLADVIEFA